MRSIRHCGVATMQLRVARETAARVREIRIREGEGINLEEVPLETLSLISCLAAVFHSLKCLAIRVALVAHWHPMVNRDVIPSADLADCLARCPAWELEGREITRTFEFTSFPGAIDFVNAVAGVAEDAGHHPDIDIRYARITLRLTTHSKGALTGADFEVAERIDNLGVEPVG